MVFQARCEKELEKWNFWTKVSNDASAPWTVLPPTALSFDLCEWCWFKILSQVLFTLKQFIYPGWFYRLLL